MPTVDVTVIHLGSFTDLDTASGTSQDANNAGAIDGKVFTDLKMVDMTYNFQRAGRSEFVFDNESNARFGTGVTYDLGSGSVSEGIDETITVDVTITHGGGTTTVESVKLFQTLSGEVFLVGETNLDGFPGISSITISEIVDSEETGLQPASKLSVDNTTVCFTAGTLIETADGARKVETLKVGDQVITADHGPQEIRWIGMHRFDAATLTRNPKLRPIHIRAGALGAGTPRRDLCVSRQHRLLISSRIVERVIGTAEVLIPAIKLTELDGIDIVEDCQSVTYFHLMCDRHEVIYAEGAATETLYPGKQAVRMIGQEAYEEIATIFPELTSPEHSAVPARYLAGTGKIAKQIIGRHKKNMRSLVEARA